MFGSPATLTVAFTNPSNSLFVQFESDSNDGLANFFIDGILAHTMNTWNGSWFAIVFSGLNYQAHTIAMQRRRRCRLE